VLRYGSITGLNAMIFPSLPLMHFHCSSILLFFFFGLNTKENSTDYPGGIILFMIAFIKNVLSIAVSAVNFSL
jgi:hypothetical protein